MKQLQYIIFFETAKRTTLYNVGFVTFRPYSLLATKLLLRIIKEIIFII
jgi:hypothetical protein